MVRVPFLPLAATLLASTFLSNATLALEPSGNVVSVDPAVNASGVGGKRLLEVEGAVFKGDEIVASPNGLAQIRFIDNTRLVVGPNSRLVIDEFVFNSDNTARKVSINALKGVFRFISGNSPHQAYSIRTPTMSVGVRGTVVDINSRGVDSSVVFLEGSGRVCDTHRRCITATADCTLHIVSRDGVRTASPQETEQRLAVFFPFIANQTELASAFHANTSNCRTPDSRIYGTPPESYQQRSSASSPYQ